MLSGLAHFCRKQTYSSLAFSQRKHRSNRFLSYQQLTTKVRRRMFFKDEACMWFLHEPDALMVRRSQYFNSRMKGTRNFGLGCEGLCLTLVYKLYCKKLPTKALGWHNVSCWIPARLCTKLDLFALRTKSDRASALESLLRLLLEKQGKQAELGIQQN